MNYRLRIDPAIHARFPDYRALVVYAEGIENAASDEYSAGVLGGAEESARATFAELPLAEHQHIQAWRQAYQSFGAKPKRFPCGVEALLKRAVSGQAIHRINKVVDIYNAVSLKWVIPSGGEDWDRLQSDLVLYPAKGDEQFVTLTGEGERTDFPATGEVVWADQAGVTVRRWNWRQCSRTLVTEETRNAYFVLDRLAPFPVEDLLQAGAELISHLRRIFPECQLCSVLLSGERASVFEPTAGVR
jgi:DNA/RNA-binding domain of Phe-tRNA-synthetase-like protein